MTMNEIRTVNVHDFKTALANAVQANAVAFITGSSGIGKDWLAAKTMANPDAWVFLDKLGDSSSGKWLIDLKRLASEVKRGRVFVGTSDNFADVVKTVIEGKDVTVLLVFPTPSASTFRAINAAKARDYQGKHPAWKAGWEQKSRLSDTGVAKYLKEKMNFFVSKVRGVIGDGRLEIWSVPTGDAKVNEGWHNWAVSMNESAQDSAKEEGKDETK